MSGMLKVDASTLRALALVLSVCCVCCRTGWPWAAAASPRRASPPDAALTPPRSMRRVAAHAARRGGAGGEGTHAAHACAGSSASSIAAPSSSVSTAVARPRAFTTAAAAPLRPAASTTTTIGARYTASVPLPSPSTWLTSLRTLPLSSSGLGGGIGVVSGLGGAPLVRHATKKAGGTVRNKNDSAGKRLGPKKSGGQLVRKGQILFRQRGFAVHAGRCERCMGCARHTPQSQDAVAQRRAVACMLGSFPVFVAPVLASYVSCYATATWVWGEIIRCMHSCLDAWLTRTCTLDIVDASVGASSCTWFRLRSPAPLWNPRVPPNHASS